LTATVELKSAKGRWRGKLTPAPRQSRVVSDPSKAGEALAEGILENWKKFRKRSREGLPGLRSPALDDAVHDLRSAARRFHSLARALPPRARGKAARRALQAARDILDWTGDLRDLAVERDSLKSVVRPDSKLAEGLLRELGRQHQRLARKAVRRLRGISLGKAHRSVRKFARALRKERAGSGVAAETVARAFDEVREARRGVDPTDPRSIHELRIALKRFRYVLEAFEPVLPAVRGRRASSVQSLQRTMGDLRDTEILTTAVSSRSKSMPDLLADTAAVLGDLERRHSGMMTSFLKSVDAILKYWDGLVEAFQQSLQGRTAT
jgi:CHAD domain-containing protein